MNRIGAAFVMLLLAGPLAAQDRYEGYYFPQVSTEEVFDRVVLDVPGADKAVRVDFVNVLTTAQLAAPESPRFVFFTKGDDDKTLILVALDDEVFATVFRARALLAQLSVNVRKSGYFKQEHLQYVATFYDLLQLLAFDELIISDGRNWAHRVTFSR